MVNNDITMNFVVRMSIRVCLMLIQAEGRAEEVFIPH